MRWNSLYALEVYEVLEEYGYTYSSDEEKEIIYGTSELFEVRESE